MRRGNKQRTKIRRRSEPLFPSSMKSRLSPASLLLPNDHDEPDDDVDATTIMHAADTTTASSSVSIPKVLFSRRTRVRRRRRYDDEKKDELMDVDEVVRHDTEAAVHHLPTTTAKSRPQQQQERLVVPWKVLRRLPRRRDSTTTTTALRMAAAAAIPTFQFSAPSRPSWMAAVLGATAAAAAVSKVLTSETVRRAFYFWMEAGPIIAHYKVREGEGTERCLPLSAAVRELVEMPIPR